MDLTRTIFKWSVPLCSKIVKAPFFVQSAKACSGCRAAPSTVQATPGREALLPFARKVLDAFDPSIPVGEASTPPAFWYTDPNVLRLEKETVFSHNWIAVARTDQLEKQGQFVSGTLADEPYLLVRGTNSTINGFYNVCRHHATILVDHPCGAVQHFECPYHGWTYNLDGRLVKATRLKGIKNFSAASFGLKRIQVTQWGPLVFARLDNKENGDEDDTPNVWLDKLGRDLYDTTTMDELTFVRRKSYKIDCNWKVFVDNYLDGGYHIPYAHKELAGALDEKTYTLEQDDRFSVQKAKGHDNDKRIGTSAIFAHIFPNLMINRYGPWMDVNYVYPTGSETCSVVFDWFLDRSLVGSSSPSEVEKMIDDDIGRSEIVQNEDIELCERVQRGLKSRSYQTGRYAPNVEYLDYNFHVDLHKDYETIFEAQ